jgi:hypothetical protein
MVEDKKETIIEMGTPVPVELDVPVPEDKPKRKRASKKVKLEEYKELEQNISMMLMTLSGMAASRDPVWQLAPEEIEAVAKPGSRILARMGAEDEANKNADYILLVVAVAGIMIPRIMIIKAKGGAKSARQPGPDEPQRPVASGSRENAGTGPRRNSNNVKELLPGLA